MEKEELQLLRIKEIIKAIQEKYIITIDWNYVNKINGKFKRIYPDTTTEDDK